MRRSAEKSTKTNRSISNKILNHSWDYVDRPIKRKITFNFEQSSPLVHYASSQGWSFPPLNRLWSYGFHARELIDMIISFPSSLFLAIQPAADIMNLLHGSDRAEDRETSIHGWQNHGDNSIEFGCKGAGEILASCDGFDLNRSPLCLLRMMFNPDTQERTNVLANSGMAGLLDMHQEELLARIAGHELPLFFTHLDMLRTFLFVLLEDILSPGLLRIKHLRLAVGPPCRRRAVLVRWHSLSHLDDRGRVIEVSALLRRSLTQPESSVGPALTCNQSRRLVSHLRIHSLSPCPPPPPPTLLSCLRVPVEPRPSCTVAPPGTPPGPPRPRPGTRTRTGCDAAGPPGRTAGR